MTSHTEPDNATFRLISMAGVQSGVFWLCTLIIALELFAGSMWALLRIPFDREQLAHLGYPLYLLYIIGVWKLGGGAVILLPRFPRLKEWAYAGALFDFSGAVASHVFVGDGPTNWAYPAEDGGVLDNLPVRFGTHVEECDLLFVLPLNASFASKVNRRSVLKRLTRVMNVRQGALERNALKLTTAINRLGADPSNKFRRIYVFTICPSGDLAVNTAEFWKTQAAGESFWTMYEATKNELANEQNFREDTNPARLQIVLVNERGVPTRMPIDDL